jgi:hypothetical protein
MEDSGMGISIIATAKEFHRDNHYVPQAYLKNWGDASNRIWAYRLLVSHHNVPLWKHTSIKGIAYHAHLYTRVVADGMTDEVEHWLNSEFEEPATEAIQKVINDNQLTPKDWSSLIRFVAVQDVRTPARLVEMLQRWSRTLPELMDNTLRESVQKMEALKREGKPLDRGSYADAKYFPMKVTTELVPGKEHGILKAETVAGRGLFLFTLKHLLVNTVDALLAHKWTILRSPKGLNWLTSDDPVVKLNYFSPEQYDFGGGWGKVGTEIYLPLSPQHMLYTKVGTKPPTRGTVVSADLANWLQRFTIEHAHRFVFGASTDEIVFQRRPRKVDPVAFTNEAEQWMRWHEEQTIAESKLLGKKCDAV